MSDTTNNCAACCCGSGACHAKPTPGEAAKRVSIVMPVLNQVDFTRGCVQSLAEDLANGVELIIVDNGSTDATPEYLATLRGVKVIRNDVNRGCAAGWNQGVNVATREWIVVLNNDVLVGAGWLDALVWFAETTDCGVVTPGLREGPLNYEFKEYAAKFVAKMSGVSRFGAANGICFMVHRSVFDKVGLFDEKFRIGQFEDADFFLRSRNAGVELGTTGSAFLHHFGSITQKAVRKTANSYEAENRAYFRQKWHLTRPRRFVQKTIQRSRNFVWRVSEQLRYGRTLHQSWVNDRLISR